MDLQCGADRHLVIVTRVPLSLYLGPRLVNVVSLAYKILTANRVLIMQPKGRTWRSRRLASGWAGAMQQCVRFIRTHSNSQNLLSRRAIHTRQFIATVQG
jgi:hypothetical protein